MVGPRVAGRRRKFRIGAGGITAACSAIVVLAGLPAVAATKPAPSLTSISLKGSDVPGFTQLSPDIQTLTDSHDQGANQAFIECAQGKTLLDQFDQGPDALDSPFYGQGTNPFGTAKFSIASVVFGDGRAGDAASAYATLAGLTFEHCWAATQDSLNRQQGLTAPIKPSVVSVLSTPRLGSNSAAFSIAQDYSVLGTPVNAQETVTVVQSGLFVVLLVTEAYESSFPASVRVVAAQHMAARMGSVSGSQPTKSVVEISNVTVRNGLVEASWRLLAGKGQVRVTGYRLTATPAGNDRVPAPAVKAASVTVPAGAASAVVDGLVMDCHQVYAISVTPLSGTTALAPARWTKLVRPSGIVGYGAPRVVVVALDGVNESQPGFTMNPMHPTLDGVDSYCPEAWDPLHAKWAESDFAGSPKGPWSFFNKWNFDMAGDPNKASDSTPRNLQTGRLTHTFMLDAIAAQGAVVLPYSYSPSSSAYLSTTTGSKAVFHFPAYSSCNATPGTAGPGCNNQGTGEIGDIDRSIGDDVTNLSNELASIHRVWPSAKLVVVGHSQGGLIAFDWWQKEGTQGRAFDIDGVSNLFSLDSPVNGVCTTGACIGPPGYPPYAKRTSVDPRLLRLDASEGNPFRFVGTFGDSVPILAGSAAYGPAGPQNLMHEILYWFNSSCAAEQSGGGSSTDSSSGFTCPVASPPDEVSACPILPDSPSWMSTDQHFITKFCPGNIAYFDSILGLGNYAPAPSVPDRSTIFVSSASSHLLGHECEATFEARAPSGSAPVARYEWLDSNENKQTDVSGPHGDMMTMTASAVTSPATFTLEVFAIGSNGLSSYTTYSTTFGSGCTPPG